MGYICTGNGAANSAVRNAASRAASAGMSASVSPAKAERQLARVSGDRPAKWASSPCPAAWPRRAGRAGQARPPSSPAGCGGPAAAARMIEQAGQQLAQLGHFQSPRAAGSQGIPAVRPREDRVGNCARPARGSGACGRRPARPCGRNVRSSMRSAAGWRIPASLPPPDLAQRAYKNIGGCAGGFQLRRQVDARPVAVGGQQQSSAAVAPAQLEHDGVARGLLDAIHAGPDRWGCSSAATAVRNMASNGMVFLHHGGKQRLDARSLPEEIQCAKQGLQPRCAGIRPAWRASECREDGRCGRGDRRRPPSGVSRGLDAQGKTRLRRDATSATVC